MNIMLILLAIGMLPFIFATNHGGNLYNIDSCCDLGYGHFTFSRKAKPSGLYVISNFCGRDHLNALAYCDTINGGGGWLVVQRRQDGSVDFNRTWEEYEDGFGKLTSEFWYGLRALHCLTRSGSWEMRIDVRLDNGHTVVHSYKQFMVASAEEKYKLTIGQYKGIATNPMRPHNGMFFTTKDYNNDRYNSGNCAISYRGLKTPAGGWWHNSCWSINPNLFYNDWQGIFVNYKWHAYTFIEIKIRPVNCSI